MLNKKNKINKIHIRNKKAAIGATLTWIIATVIIFFAIMLLVYLSGILSISKKITSFEAKIVSGNDLETTQLLSSILQTKISTGDKKISELILESMEKEDYKVLEKELAKEFDKLSSLYSWDFNFKIYENERNVKSILDTVLYEDIDARAQMYLSDNIYVVIETEEKGLDYSTIFLHLDVSRPLI